MDRIRTAVRMFFRSECDEAAFRTALEEAAPLYRDAPEARTHAEASRQLMVSFMNEALPGVAARERTFVADMVRTVVSSAGKAISSENRSRSEVDALAIAIGEMFCAYLERYPRRGR